MIVRVAVKAEAVGAPGTDEGAASDSAALALEQTLAQAISTFLPAELFAPRLFFSFRIYSSSLVSGAEVDSVVTSNSFEGIALLRNNSRLLLGSLEGRLRLGILSTQCSSVAGISVFFL